MMNKDTFTLGGKEFSSRFILGSGKYSLDLIKAAVENAGAEIITLAVRRTNTKATENILDYILVESEKHNVYQKEIEKEFGLRPSTATEVLKHLEEEGLIVRIPDEDDGRYKKIVFTEKAEEIQNALRREIVRSEEILLEGISPEEQEIFMKITAKMLENLEREE